MTVQQSIDDVCARVRHEMMGLETARKNAQDRADQTEARIVEQRKEIDKLRAEIKRLERLLGKDVVG